MKTTIKGTLITAFVAFALQSCTHDIYVDPQGAEKTAYENADAVNGAKLFSNFEHVDAGWPVVIQSDIDLDATLAGLLGWPNPKFANDPTINIKDIATPPRTTPVTPGQANLNYYSCISCHPSDGMARTEIGNNKKTALTQPEIATNNLRDVRSWEITTLFNAIKNVGGRAIDPTKTANGLDLTLGGQTHPDFSKILTEDKIWDLVKYLKEGAIYNEGNDMYTVNTVGTYAVPQTVPAPYALFSNLGSDGDEAAGVAYYTAKCTVCHGVDGHGTTNAQGPILALGQVNGTGAANATNPATAAKKYGLGPFMRYRTPDGMLKIVAGQFGTTPWMGATPITRTEMKNLLKAFSNTARFPDFTIALPNP